MIDAPSERKDQVNILGLQLEEGWMWRIGEDAALSEIEIYGRPGWGRRNVEARCRG
jgi:hypothetical protein